MDGNVAMENASENFSKAERLEIWREAMAHLRFLNDEAWKRFQFFVWFDLIVFLVAIAAARNSRLLAVIFCAVGLFLAFAARYILKRNRVYYLQMLMKKTLVEETLGFYREKLFGTEIDLAFPWRLTPETAEEIKKGPEAWVQKSIRGPGTIARWQFVIYEIWIGIYALLFIALVFKRTV